MCYNRLAMDKNLGFKGYGTRCFAFLIDAALSVVLSIVLYFTLGKFGIEGPLGYQEKHEQMVRLVDDSGLADENGTAFYFEPISEEGELGADKYGEIVWDYYFSVIPSNPDLVFYESDELKGEETDKEAVGRWIYEHVYSYDGSSINPYFAFTSFTTKPDYSETTKADLANPETKEEMAASLLDFYYKLEDGAAAGAYVEAFYHFGEQPVYVNLYQECSSILYYEALPSYLIPPLLVFGLVPLILKGRTIGKLAFKLYVVNKDGKQAKWHELVRHYGFIAIIFMLPAIPFNSSFLILLSGFLLLIDFIVLLMSKRKLSLHDMLSSTIVYGVIGERASGESSDYIDEKPDSSEE